MRRQQTLSLSSIILFKMFFPYDSFKYLAFEVEESNESFN